MNTQTIETTEHQGQIASIVELSNAYTKASKTMRDDTGRETCDSFEEAEKAIREDALEVCVRSGWVASLEGKVTAEEFFILLATGGPAYRLIGNLNQGQPEYVKLQHQDWGTTWTDVALTDEEHEACMIYAGVFYFGDN